MIKNVNWSPCKVPLILSDFKYTWIFSTDFQKILKYQIAWISVQWEPSFFMRADGQTDKHDEALSSASQFFERA
jgi:hypothetical protein